MKDIINQVLYNVLSIVSSVQSIIKRKRRRHKTNKKAAKADPQVTQMLGLRSWDIKPNNMNMFKNLKEKVKLMSNR
jgi:phage shock protein A